MADRVIIPESAEPTSECLPMAIRNLDRPADIPEGWVVVYNAEAFLTDEDWEHVIRLERSGSLDFWREEEDLYGAEDE